MQRTTPHLRLVKCERGESRGNGSARSQVTGLTKEDRARVARQLQAMAGEVVNRGPNLAKALLRLARMTETGAV